MVKVRKQIVQYVSNDGYTFIRDFEVVASFYTRVYDDLYKTVENYPMRFIWNAQNPVGFSLSSGKTTLYPDDVWSDSPENDPDRPVRQRFSWGQPYGMYERTWNHDSFHGLLMFESDFSDSCEYNVIDFQGKNDCLVKDNDFSRESEKLLPHLKIVDNDASIFQFPFVLEALPVPFSYRNPIDTNIYIRLGNYFSELDPENVRLFIDGKEIFDIIITPFYEGSGGLDLLWENAFTFDYGSEVEVRWIVGDMSDPVNYIEIRYLFHVIRDVTGPRVVDEYPKSGTKEVPTNIAPGFYVLDYESGVNINSLVVHVNNYRVLNQDCSIQEVDEGYYVSYVPPHEFINGDIIPVSVYIEDKAGNGTYFVYKFTTKESRVIRMVASNPEHRELGVPINAVVFAYVVGSGDGVYKDHLVFSVDGVSIDHPIFSRIVFRE